MNSISRIRAQLGVTQSALAEALDVTQGNISHYERGQVVPPDVARRLIDYAARLGHQLRFDDIYAADTPPAPPAIRRATDPTPPPAHAGRQPASPHQIMDTIPCRAVVVATGEKV